MKNFDSKGRQVVGLVTKKDDPLAKIAEEERIAACKHPHVQFQRKGFEIRCLDCPRRWVAAMTQKGIEYDMADFGYWNPKIPDGDFRHSPDEVQRIKPIR